MIHHLAGIATDTNPQPTAEGVTGAPKQSPAFARLKDQKRGEMDWLPTITANCHTKRSDSAREMAKMATMGLRVAIMIIYGWWRFIMMVDE